VGIRTASGAEARADPIPRQHDRGYGHIEAARTRGTRRLAVAVKATRDKPAHLALVSLWSRFGIDLLATDFALRGPYTRKQRRFPAASLRIHEIWPTFEVWFLDF
jgi:hypothetical protein